MKKNYKTLTIIIFTLLMICGYISAMFAQAAGDKVKKEKENTKTSPPKENAKGSDKGLGSILGRRYFDVANGFSFRPPKGWKKITPNNSQHLTFRSPEIKSGFYSNVTVQVEEWPASLATYVVQATENLRRQMASCEIKYEGGLRISGKEAYQICSKALFRQMNTVLTIRQLQIITVAYGQVYVISFSSLERDFASNKKVFELSASTFRVAPKRSRKRIFERNPR